MKKENKKSNIKKDNPVDFEDLYKRAIADYQNLKRRSEDEKRNMVKFSNEVLITKLLSVLIDLEIAKEHLKDQGINNVYKKMMDVLIAEGLEVIDPIESDFNSSEHEAVESVDGEDGKIIKVLQKGFKLNSKILKPAIVAVGNGK